MQAFLQNAISFAFLNITFVWTNIQALYIQNLSCISVRLQGYLFIIIFFFCTRQELWNPTIYKLLALCQVWLHLDPKYFHVAGQMPQ